MAPAPTGGYRWATLLRYICQRIAPSIALAPAFAALPATEQLPHPG